MIIVNIKNTFEYIIAVNDNNSFIRRISKEMLDLLL